MLKKSDVRPPRSDGMAAARFAVKAVVIVSFLLLVTGINYATTGEVPSLWNTGDVLASTTEQAVNFMGRGLRDEAEVRVFTPILTLKPPHRLFFSIASCRTRLTSLILFRTTALPLFLPYKLTNVLLSK